MPASTTYLQVVNGQHPFVMHIGIDISEALTFEKLRLPVATDLDGWLAWGEPMSDGVNDARTIHYLIAITAPTSLGPPVKTIGSMLDLIKNGSIHLVRSKPTASTPSVMWAVTPAGDWSDVWMSA